MTTIDPVEAARARRKVSVADIHRFPDRIDVRSPAEFADDHLPGAENRPVLDDDERARVGTLHAQGWEVVAKRVGAALVARRIAAMLDGPFAERPRDWAPLVYCWRGGKRSAALAHMLWEIGWKAVQLDGGYRAYRRHVIARLEELPPRFRYRVVCGLTGSGKSRLLAALAARGAQVLDLEAIARHRGSLLGDLPGDPQPSQKWFESQVLDALERLDPARIVYVESESKKIGDVQVPEALLATMRASSCLDLATPQPMRVELLKAEYAHYLASPEALNERLGKLVELHGHKAIGHWAAIAAAGDWDTLVADLLAKHYDPSYLRAIDRNFPLARLAESIVPDGIDDRDFAALAARLVASEEIPA